MEGGERCVVRCDEGGLTANGLVVVERFSGLSSMETTAEERHGIVLPRACKSGYKTVNVKSAKAANPY